MPAISTHTYQLLSQQDKLPLDVMVVQPTAFPKAIVQLAHGMCEHKERYRPLMAFLAEQGFYCVMHDHRGHGKSVRQTADLGYFYEAGGPGVVEDMKQLTEYVKTAYPQLPYFLLGHSMGSLAVRSYLKKYDRYLSGVFLCGSPSYKRGLTAAHSLLKILIALRGDRARSKLINHLFANNFNRPFRHEKTENAWVCSDSSVIRTYNQDPLCHFTFTLNGYNALLYLMQETYSTKGWQLQNADLPIRFLSGINDPCRVNDAEFYKAVSHLQNRGYNHVTARLFDNMRHEILNEQGKEAVYRDIADTFDVWLNNCQSANL